MSLEYLEHVIETMTKRAQRKRQKIRKQLIEEICDKFGEDLYGIMLIVVDKDELDSLV